MAEMPVPFVDPKAGYEPRMVPRCRARGVANPADPSEEWTTRRCIRPDRHRGTHILSINGMTVRFT